MLVDINSYIGHWPFRQLRGNTLDAMLQRMNEFGVDKAIVANINGIFYKDNQPANEELYNAIQSKDKFKDRFIPIAVINPVLPWWEKMLEICHTKLGMQGIRIFPLYHQYSITDQRCIDLVRAASNLNMPVSIPLRMIDLRQRSWLDINKQLSLNDVASLIREVPEAQYIVLDVRQRWGEEDEESTKILKETDILFDTPRLTSTPIGASFQYMLDTYGPEKLAFGTETPFIDYCSPFIRLGKLEARKKTKDLIRSGNARRMFKYIK